MSIGVSGVTHLIGHIFLCRWIPSISGFDSVSRAHFRSESVRGLTTFNKIRHFILVEGDC